MRVKEKGAVLVMLALLLVALIAVAALSLDIGRLLVLKTEMQNAADAAALAAAAELDGQEDAQARARLAARNLLEHDSHFAKVKTLLGPDVPAERYIEIKFFCAIENNIALAPSTTQTECTGGPGDAPDTGKIKNLDDTDAHFVRITLNPKGEKLSTNTITLYFMQVYDKYLKEAFTTATAVAGHSFVVCNYPPLMICNPNDTSADSPVTIPNGTQVELLYIGPQSTWRPGNFGLLDPPGQTNSGANDIRDNLAESTNTCSEPYISPHPGVDAGPMINGINTRFGIYNHVDETPKTAAALNVLDYPRDSNLATSVQDPNSDVAYRFGNGSWRSPVYFPTGELASTPAKPSYWSLFHSTGEDPGFATRYQYYQYELSNELPSFQIMNADGVTPSLPSDIAPCDPVVGDCRVPGKALSYIWNGEPSSAQYQPQPSIDRRVITVPVLNCNEIDGLQGNQLKKIWVGQEQYWKKFFLTEHVQTTNSGTAIYAEYLGGVSEGDGTLRVEVKLYE